ncbi:hypothetical protein FGO68_gene15171 [Halteria grandinella]|uniref:Uncharacterized protein n=1 Tax=Halteria grandinella TaxID=5974 RepID=A0A8J8NC73_HALGN|nr:hypothetical protein FGO68_gene15171 [Halteria grandinella]
MRQLQLQISSCKNLNQILFQICPFDLRTISNPYIIDHIHPNRKAAVSSCKRPQQKPPTLKGPAQEFTRVPKPGRKMFRQRQKQARPVLVLLIAAGGQHIGIIINTIKGS